MSARDHLQPRARRDIESAFLWYAVHAGMLIAERFATAVIDTIDEIVEHPWSGRKCTMDLSELAGVRSRTVAAFDAYVVFYVADEKLEVLRILHGARDLERVLLDRDEPDAVQETPITARGLYPAPADTAWRVAC